jgi:precorrin-2 dehydrogenase/sirohydrochlorin ferrochelatase
VPFAYPIALELTGRRCVVVGGDAIAESKARALLEAGAEVTVVAADAAPGLADLAGRGDLVIERRSYRPGDLAGAALVVSCDPAHHAAVFAEADACGVLCNAVDDVPHSHFAAPSVVRRGDLVLTVSTGGRSPALAKRLRRRLAEEYSSDYGVLVDLLGAARASALAARTCDFATWAARWEDVLRNEGDLLVLIRAGRPAEVVAWVVDRLGGAQPCDLKPCSSSPQASGSVR